jgi:NAD(P)-dependent dehydrogenase (short-subunit alcohol dehydrogenase family)
MASRPGNETLVQKVNFLSQRFLTEALLPRITDNGSVTLISSSGGYGWEANYDLVGQVLRCETYEDCVAFYEAHPEAIVRAYPFSKQCLNAYVQYMAFDPTVIDRKIRINAICPGNTLTGLTDEFNRSASPTGDAEEGKAIIESIYLKRWNGRWATSEEMGYPLVAIGSRLFSYMSGQVIYFDYGLASTWTIDALEGRKGGSDILKSGKTE